MASTSNQPVSIGQATTPADLAAIVECFRAYTEWLGEDLAFQDYAAELNGLPGKYAPPSGALLLARDTDTGQALGCIALRPLELAAEYRDSRRRRRDDDEDDGDDGDDGNRGDGEVRYCEIKRLFVYPAARGRRLARVLIAEVSGREGRI